MEKEKDIKNKKNKNVNAENNLKTTKKKASIKKSKTVEGDKTKTSPKKKPTSTTKNSETAKKKPSDSSNKSKTKAQSTKKKVEKAVVEKNSKTKKVKAISETSKEKTTTVKKKPTAAKKDINSKSKDANIHEIKKEEKVETKKVKTEEIKPEIKSTKKINEPPKSKIIKPIKFIIPLVIILLIILGLFIFFKKDEKIVKEPDDIEKITFAEKFNQNKPIRIKENGKYGFINTKGEVIVKPILEDASEFYGDYAIISSKVEKEHGKYDTKYQIINNKGKVKFEVNGNIRPKYNVEYDYWIIDSALYTGDFKKITKEGVNVSDLENGYIEFEDTIKDEAGVMDYKGNKIFTVPDTSITIDISHNKDTADDLYIAIKSYKYDKINIVSLKTGETLYTVPNGINYISTERNGIFSYYEKTYDNKTFLYFKDGKLVYKSSNDLYDLEIYDLKNKILELDYGYKYQSKGKVDRYEYYDIKEEKILDNKPELTLIKDIEKESPLKLYGFKKFTSGSKTGITDGENILVSAEYDNIDFLNYPVFKYLEDKNKQEIVLLKKDNKTEIMNIKDKTILGTIDSIYVHTYADTTFIKSTKYKSDTVEETKYVVYNLLTNKSIEIPYSNRINLESNYFTTVANGKKSYYNNNLEMIYETIE